MPSTKPVKVLSASVAVLLAAMGALYYFIWHNNYDQALRETSTRINSLANIELNIDNAGDITYGDLEKKIEQYISETEAIYARVGKAGNDSVAGSEKIAKDYLAASLKFQRTMKLRYQTQIWSNSLSKQAREAADNRMSTPYYTGGNPMAALSAFNASMEPIMRLLSEAREAESKAANAKQSFIEATTLLITATQKAKSITSHDNLANLSLLEKINSQPK